MSSDMVILPDGWSLIKDIPQQDMCQVEVRFITPDGKTNSLVFQFETTEDGTGSILDSGGNNIGTWDDLISTMMYGDCCPYAWTYFKSAWTQKDLQSENEQLRGTLIDVGKYMVILRDVCAREEIKTTPEIGIFITQIKQILKEKI